MEYISWGPSLKEKNCIVACNLFWALNISENMMKIVCLYANQDREKKRSMEALLRHNQALLYYKKIMLVCCLTVVTSKHNPTATKE